MVAPLEIPGVAAQVERQNRVRDVSFLPIQETIAGVDVMPLTPARLLVLMAIESPFVTMSRLPEAYDIAAILWALNSHYAPPPLSWSQNREKKRILKACRRFKQGSWPYIEAVKSVERYLEESMMDGPPRRDGDAGDPPTASAMAWLVHRIASAYHWSEAEIMQMPLKRLWQYLKIIDGRQGNPSDKAIADWLAEQNKGRTPEEVPAVTIEPVDNNG